MKAFYLLLSIFLYASNLSEALASDFSFKYRLEILSMNQGLSQHDISSIAQDRYGFIWIATYDGLLRYDGYTFKTYRFDDTNPKSISDNRILSIYLDSAENLWIGTEGGGLNLYNYDLEEFSKFKFSENPLDNNIYSIYEDNEHNLWAGTGCGVYKLNYSPENRELRITPIVSNFEEMTNVRAIYRNSKDEMILGTTIGLYTLNPNNTPPSHSHILPQKLPNITSSIFAIETLDDKHLLLGGYEGLFLYHRDTHQIEKILTSYQQLERIHTIRKQSEDTFLIGTENAGILTLTYQKQSYRIEKLATDENEYLEKSIIKAIFIDNMQNLWIGTGTNGVGRLNLLSPHFYRFFDVKKEDRNFIRAFYKDRANRMWIQIKQKSLFYINEKQNNPIPVTLPQTANSITEDNEGNIWISTTDNIYMLEQKNNFQHPRSVIPTQTSHKEKITNIRGIQSDSKGNIWAGYRNGLILIKKTKLDKFEIKIYNKFNLKNSQININNLYFEKGTHHLWACTRDFGLFMFELDEQSNITNQTRFYLSDNHNEQINSNHVWAVTQSSSNKIWIGTDAGLNSIDFSGGKIQIKSFNHISQLRNIKILSIIEDTNSALWLATSKGLIKFTPTTNEINRFYYKDGLSNNSLMETSQIDDNGIIYFASINGITYFHPDEITRNPIKPQVLITKLQVFNKEVEIGKKKNGRVLLPKSILETSEITLKHNENNFTINYVGIHFNNPQSNKFAHQLVGYDKDWIYGGAENRSASYNNLAPGKYQLRIKASNSDQVWADEYRTLDIEILAAPWASWWAYLTYTLLGIIIIYIIVIHYKRQEKLKYKLHIEQLERIHDKEMNDNRLKFHTNIAHEIKTPLTLISAPLQELVKHPTDDTFIISRLQIIQQSTDRLSNLINQFLDLRKIDKEALPLSIQETNIAHLFEAILESFRPLAEQKGINFQYFSDSSEIQGWIDRDKVSKILNNLLSNAIKFTQKGHQITVFIAKEEDHIFFTVEDNGCGISEQDLPHIFDRFYQCGTQQSSGTGIGLSLVYELIQLHHGKISVTSTIEVGTTFNVSIPITQHYYKEEEINQSHIQEEQQSNLLQEESPVQLSASKQIILVIEDDYDMRKYLHQYLSPHFEVLTEDNAFSGYETALKYIPNLIITDIMMPGMNGLELCNKLKNDFHTSHIPVIILTAKAAEEDLLKGYQSGAEIYITKPFNPDSLILQVRNMISLKKYQERNTLNTNDDDTNENKDYIALDEREQKFINKLNNWLELHLEETDYNIEDICKEIGTSRMQLHRKLTALLGQSASEFIRCYKMKRAKELLESGNFNVSEVVYKTGFKNNSHFTKTFKKTYGHLPSELL